MPVLSFLSRWPRGAKIAGGVALGLVAAVVAAALLLNDAFVKSFVSKQVAERTGRHFAIRGPFAIDWSAHPQIVAEDIVFGNAAGGSREEMARVKRAALRIDLAALLRGRVALTELSLDAPDVLFERLAPGANGGGANWDFGDKQQQKGGGAGPEIRRLAIRDGVFYYRDAAKGTDLKVELATLPAGTDTAATTAARLRIAGNGRFRRESFKLSGVIDSLLALRTPDDPFRLALRGTIGGTQARIDGSMIDPLNLGGMDIALDLRGPDIGKLHDVIKLPFPESPPYRLKGRLARAGDVWRFSEFDGRVGDSDIAGDFSIDVGGERAKMQIDLASRSLDFDDLAPLIGRAPKVGPGETASGAQKQEARREAAAPRVLPRKPFNLEKLREADAQFKFVAYKVRAGKAPLDSILADGELSNGKLHFRKLDLGLAGGKVDGVVTLDAAKSPIATDMDITLTRLDLARLVPQFGGIIKQGAGRFGGRAKFSTHGNSIADMAAGMNGAVGVAIGGGEISKLLTEAAGLEIGKVLVTWARGDENVKIRCGVGDFRVQNGTMHVNTLVFDTENTKIVGHGSIDLAREALDLTLRAEPKSKSILTATSPLELTGTLKNPGVGLEGKKLAGRALGAAALGAAAPPAALLALIGQGEGKDADCAGLLESVSRKTREAASQR